MKMQPYDPDKISVAKHYRSFFEAAKLLPTDEEKLSFYLALDYHRFESKEWPLVGQAKLAFTLAKPNVDADLDAKISGATGGAPQGNQNARKNKNNPRCFAKTTNDNEDDNEDEDDNANADADDPAICDRQPDLSDPKQLFLHLWGASKDKDGICVFSPSAKVEKPEEWEEFWKGSDLSCEHIKLALRNFVTGIDNGSIPRRYIPATPDRFVLGGGLTRHLDAMDEKKGNSNVAPLPDDKIRL